jgi:hypothetical protein
MTNNNNNNNDKDDIKTPFFSYKKFKKTTQNNDNSENIMSQPTTRSKFKNNARWVSTSTEYYLERLKYYYNTYIPDILGYSETSPEILQLKQNQIDLQNTRDQRKIKLAAVLNKNTNAVKLKYKTCQTWQSISNELISLEFQRGLTYPDYSSQLDVDQLMLQLCANIQCESAGITVPEIVVPEKKTQYHNNNNNNNNLDTELRFEEIRNQLKLAKQESSNQSLKVNELQDKLTTCNLKQQKIETQNFNQPIKNIGTKMETRNKIFNLFNSKSRSSLNDYKSPEQYQKQFFESQIASQKRFYEDSIRLIHNRPKFNMINRISNSSRSFISTTLSSVVWNLFFLILSAVITIWILNLFKTLIIDGLAQLRNLKANDHDNKKDTKKDKKKQRRRISKNATAIAEFLGPIANFIRVMRGGCLVPLSTVLLSDITNHELLMATSPITYIVKKQILMKELQSVLARSSSSREAIRYYTTQPIIRKFKSVSLPKELILVIFTLILLTSQPCSLVNKKFNCHFEPSRKVHINKHCNYNYEQKLILKNNDKPFDSIEVEPLIVKNKIVEPLTKVRKKKRRSKIKRFTDLPRLKKYDEEEDDQITDNCYPSTTQPIKIKY